MVVYPEDYGIKVMIIFVIQFYLTIFFSNYLNQITYRAKRFGVTYGYEHREPVLKVVTCTQVTDIQVPPVSNSVQDVSVPPTFIWCKEA